MKRLYFTAIMLLQLLAPLHAGKLNLEYQAGMGTYGMTDFRWIGYEIENQPSLILKKLSNFGPYFFWRPMLSYTLGNNEFGFAYTLQSTGSRIYASDYSGTYCYDMRVKASGLGVLYSLRMNNLGPFQAWMYSNVGINFSNFSILETFELYDTELSDFSVKLKSANPYFEVGVRLVYPLKHFSLSLNMGYQYQPMGGQKMYEENKDEPFEAMNSKYLYPEWTGARISFGISKSLQFLHL